MKILIIRFSSIGDIVLTSPIVRCVKEQIKGAEIDFLTKNSFTPLVKHNPHIKSVIALNQDLKVTIKALKASKYDIVIDLHKNLRTTQIKRNLKAKWFTYNKLNIRKWLFVNFKLDILPNVHIVDRYFEGLNKLEVKNDNKGLDYFLSTDYKASSFLTNLTSRSFTIISIGGTYATKRISNTLLVTVIKRLKTLCVVIGGGKEDQQNADEITKYLSPDSVLNLVNKISIEDSAYLIKNSQNILTGDTGMMHIAAAFKKPIISVWGNTHPKLGMYPYLPKSKENLFSVHQVKLNCRPCSKLGSVKCPRQHFNCMNLQNVDEIVKNCNSIEYVQ